MFEKKHQSLLPPHLFLRRVVRSICIALMIVVMSLAFGMAGYHHYENMSWVDAFVNASMILSGMGPVTSLQTDPGKIFAGFYALFSGIIFLIVMAIILAPIIHRFFHKFHLEEESKK